MNLLPISGQLPCFGIDLEVGETVYKMSVHERSFMEPRIGIDVLSRFISPF
jgi:hypothetical protein